MSCFVSEKAQMPGLLVQRIGCTGMVKTSISFQGWHLPCGRTCRTFGVSEAGTAEKENDEMFHLLEKHRCQGCWASE